MHTLEQLQSGQLVGAQRLKLSCGLDTFPLEILDLSDTLEMLDSSNNHLTHLPNDFDHLQKLKIAFFSNNEFTEVPAVLSKCSCLETISFRANKIAFIPEQVFSPSIRSLILTNNQLTTIPSAINRCVRLQKAMFAGNALVDLPSTMAQCKNLELLRISVNRLAKIPSWLFSMSRLSWLAFASNTGTEVSPTEYDLAEIPWDELTIVEQLGEGASGIISKAQWPGKPQKEVAVKLFKGEMTSDGLPTDEMYTCMAAGAHANLVKVFGRIDGHPEQKSGLILELIPSTFKTLAGPPSLDTCTRDIYPSDAVFRLSKLVQIASGIALAAAHLHSHGIMHGDLYAHNILVDPHHTLLSDFGAATMYARNYSTEAPAIERLEVRAFGCLLEELLDRIDPNDTDPTQIIALAQLKDDCTQWEVLQRPSFAIICERIAGFRKLI